MFTLYTMYTLYTLKCQMCCWFIYSWCLSWLFEIDFDEHLKKFKHILKRILFPQPICWGEPWTRLTGWASLVVSEWGGSASPTSRLRDCSCWQIPSRSLPTTSWPAAYWEICKHKDLNSAASLDVEGLMSNRLEPESGCYLAKTRSLMPFSFPYCTDCTSVRPLEKRKTFD